MTNKPAKLSLKEKMGYGFGDLASVLYWQTFMLYFTYFYTDVFLIPASVAATMFLVSRLWDGVNDPLMGIIADRTNTKWGKFRPFLLWLCVPFAVAGVLVFTVPDFEMSGKVIWAYGTFMLIMMLYTAINIPYTSLLGVISPDSNERTSVSSIKFLFAFAAGIIVSATLLPMTKILGGGDTSIISAKLNDQTINVKEVGKGDAKIVIYAEDEDGLKSQLEFGFRVNQVNNNMPTIVKPINDTRLEVGFKEYKIDISEIFIGKGSDPFTYTVINENEDIVEVVLNEKQLVIKEKSIGSAKIKITAKDEYWGSKTNSFYININKLGNTNPYINDSLNTNKLHKLVNGYKKEEIDLSKIIIDPDGDKLLFTAESNNEKIIAPKIENGKLYFLEAENGIAEISIAAADGNGGLQKYKIKYLIAAQENNPPYINNQVANILQVIGFDTNNVNFEGAFIDPEGKPLKYTIEVINNAKGWSRSFMIYGIGAVIFFLIAFKSTKERIHPPKSQKTSIKKDLRNLVTNKPWLLLLATTITFILFVAVRGSVTVHYFKYIIGQQDFTIPFLGTDTYGFEAIASAYNTIGQLSAFIGVILVAKFSSIVGKKKAYVLLFVIAIFSTAVLYFLSADQLGLIFFFQITGSMTGGPLSVLIWAMYADTADYAEWKKGTRSTGLIFSASTMSQKFGWAFGAFVALNLMAQLGFQPNVAQSADSLNGLLMLFSLIPAGMGVISIILIIFYPLNDKKVQEIETELKERRRLDDSTTEATA